MQVGNMLVDPVASAADRDWQGMTEVNTFSLLAAGMVMVTTSAVAGPMAELTGSKRMLLVFAEDADPALAEQRALLEGAGPGALRERDLLVLFVPPLGTSRAVFGDAAGAYPAEALRRNFDVAPTSQFTALLVGKDGGVKWRATRPTPPDEIFSVIDAMPMRLDEMRRNAPPG